MKITESQLREIIREELKTLKQESKFKKSDIEKAIKAQDILDNRNIVGRERKKAVIDLYKIASKYSEEPIRTVKGALLTLDLIEPYIR